METTVDRRAWIGAGIAVALAACVSGAWLVTAFGGNVTGGDRSAVKGQIGSPLDGTNFWMDLDKSGGITGGDRSTAKGKIGNSVDCP